MKFSFLIIFILSLSANANYVSESEVKNKNVKDVFRSKSRCVSVKRDVCHFVDSKTFNIESASIVNETVDDEESPIWGQRSLVEECAGEDDCKEKALAKECSDERWPLYNEEYSEVWCNKHVGYNKKPTGNKVIVVDAEKKEALDLKIEKNKARKERVARGRVNREKCKAALDYVAGSNTDSAMTEEQIDAMETAFAPILDALQKNRPQKAARLITNVIDPVYSELKDNLLEILK